MDLIQTINGNGSKTMAKFDKTNLPDVQATEDTRGIEISRVGVEGVHYPLTIKRKNDGKIQVLAEFNMFGSLTKHLKGTNMSRPVELLMEQGENTISGNTFPPFLELLSKKLGAEDVYVSASFDYWMNRTSPVSKKVFPLKYDCKFIGQIYKGKVTFVVEASVPITTVCPCSKEMSLTDKEEGIGRGAHNQRGIVTLQVVTDPVSPGVWIEDLVEIAEASGSAPLYALLKRPDEKFVTEQAYDNPRFVEDVAREAALGVHKVENASWFKVRIRNYEAIHNHQATAYVCQKKVNNEWITDSRAFF